MTLARNTLLAVLTSAAIGTAAQSAQADTYHHIDELALELQEQARELYSELGTHCRHVENFSHLRSDAAKMYHMAIHVHSVAHRHGELRHLEEDLRKADDLFHHLEDMVEESAGDDHHGFGGHSHGVSRHVHRIMHDMEDTLHHLQNDIEDLTHAHHAVPSRPAIGAAPPAGYGREFRRPVSGRDEYRDRFQIGNNGWSFRFSR